MEMERMGTAAVEREAGGEVQRMIFFNKLR
jgi:hypothetical protein